MNRYLLAIFAIVLMVFTTGAGCQQSSSGISSGSFLGGTQGLAMQFMEGAPPLTVYDQGNFPFSVQVKVENVGEHDVASGEYVLSVQGVDPGEFGNPTMSVAGSDPLEGKEKDSEGNVIPGGITYVDFGSWDYTGSVTGTTTYTLRVDNCYKYGSRAIAMLCVKEDLLDTEPNAICRVNEAKPVSNAGSPIQITGLTESAMGNNRISFSFKVSHRGAGAISIPQAGAPTCSDALTEENVVNVRVETGIGGTLDCSGLDGASGSGMDSGDVQLFEGLRTIRCTQDIPAFPNDFEKAVNVYAGFEYKEHVQTPLYVKHAA